MKLKKQLLQGMLLMLFAVTVASCSKHKEFKNYYGKSGIWEITTLKVDYLNDSTGVIIDSSKTYSNCGMFIFYNTDIGALREAYLGQVGITTFKENHLGIAWYPENDKMNFTLSTANTPIRTYTISGKGATQTWTYTGKNNSVLPGTAQYVNETLTVNRISTKNK